MTKSRETIDANGTPVSAFHDAKTKKDYLSLTDIAKYKNSEAPNDLIKIGCVHEIQWNTWGYGNK